jgi:hypothetical protein
LIQSYIHFTLLESKTECLDSRYQWLTDTCTLIGANRVYLHWWWSTISLLHLASTQYHSLNGTTVHVMCQLTFMLLLYKFDGGGHFVAGNVSWAVRLSDYNLCGWTLSVTASMTCISLCQMCSSKGVSVAVSEICWHAQTYWNDGYVPLQCQEFHDLLIFYLQRHRVMHYVLYISCSLYCSMMYLLKTYTYLCPINKCVRFNADCCNIIPVMCCTIFFRCFICVIVTVCCTHVTSTVYCCVRFVTVIYSYKILLSLWYLSYRSGTCVCCNS